MPDLNLDGIQSSYHENHYGHFFYSIVRTYQPQLVVELGTFMGYSGIHMAAALRDNSSIHSQLHLTDLWDKYPYRHCSEEMTRENFKKNGLLDQGNLQVRFFNRDAYKSASSYENNALDLLHIDISNDGESLSQCLKHWHNRLKPGGILLIEGGSNERDKIDWMLKYSKKPIQSFLKSHWFQADYEFTVIEPFPSLTIARRVK